MIAGMRGWIDDNCRFASVVMVEGSFQFHRRRPCNQRM